MIAQIKKTESKILYPFGVTIIENGFHISIARKTKRCFVLLYKRNVKEPVLKLEIPSEYKRGDVWEADIFLCDDKGKTISLENIEYNFEDDKGVYADPYGKAFSGRDSFGKRAKEGCVRRSPLCIADFDWESDKLPDRDISDDIIYKIHVRGFTKDDSSKTLHPGTFDAIIEKIDYIKALGANTLLLMPAQEYEEIMDSNIGIYKNKRSTALRVNYWGYTPAYAFAPKASFCKKKSRNPINEFKNMIKQLHKEDIAVIIELYFEGCESISYVLDVIRWWRLEYHIDGIRIVGRADIKSIYNDPYLSGLKIYAENIDGLDFEAGKRTVCEYNNGFKNDMRRILKGDEGMLGSLMYRITNISDRAGTVNYIADTEGFTLWDMLSFDIKHNEANREANKDGTDANFSWNCGVEGATRKRTVMELRYKQYRNAMLMLLLSQGTPLILSGDEFGRSKEGNNNSYCQDNKTSWLDWKLEKKNKRLLEFTKYVIEFRKKHPVFRYKEKPTMLDTKAVGLPDVSYHGEMAWQVNMESYRRQLGVLYCGSYAQKADGSSDDNIYVIYNMHWEAHSFALPSAGEGFRWYVAIDTSVAGTDGYYKAGKEKRLADNSRYILEARTIVVLIAKKIRTRKRVSAR